MDDDFNSLIPSLYQDHDPFLFQYTAIPTVPSPDHTIFQDLQDHAAPPNSSLVITSPRGEGGQVVTTTTTITNNNNNNNNKGKRFPKPSNIQNNDNGDPVDDSEKRAVHRDIERQRRQEMANLYASLRMLLPLEYIKGKRATTDHIHQAANYIKHMETKITELEMKRNKLRNLLGESHLDVQSGAEARSFSSNIAFTVSSCSDGRIEILMKSDLADDSFPLSKVLNVLLNKGLTVVSCIYTKVNQKFHCTIHTEKSDCQMNDGDLYSLQEKLNAKVMDWKSLGPS